jgi:hypothetical protein
MRKPMSSNNKAWNPWLWTGCLVVLPHEPLSLGLGKRPRSQRSHTTTLETPVSSGSADMEIGMEVGYDGIATPRVQLHDPYPFSRN